MRFEFNFVGSDVASSDVDLFLGPRDEEDGPFFVIQPGWIMAHILHAAGVFLSVKQAKSNGWDKPIPIGYSEYTVTKRKLRIYILTRFD